MFWMDFAVDLCWSAHFILLLHVYKCLMKWLNFSILRVMFFYLCVCVCGGRFTASHKYSKPIHIIHFLSCSFSCRYFLSIYCPESQCVCALECALEFQALKHRKIDINPTYKHIHSYTSWWIWKKQAGSWDWLKLGWRMDRWGALRKGWSKKSITGEYQEKKLWWMSKCKTLSNA